MRHCNTCDKKTKETEVTVSGVDIIVCSQCKCYHNGIPIQDTVILKCVKDLENHYDTLIEHLLGLESQKFLDETRILFSHPRFFTTICLDSRFLPKIQECTELKKQGKIVLK